MHKISRHIVTGLSTAALLLPCGLSALAEDVPTAERPFDEITATSQRQDRSQSDNAGNIAVISAAAIRSSGHHHAHEILARAAGTWISRGSGQESLPAIRSPVLTGAGSCGSFLMLEDGIPVRPASFCNVNQLFELDTENAERIEIIRGPGTALYGSNALHGIINIINADVGANSAAVELGANDFVRARATLSGERSIGTIVFADDGGFREDSGYRQLKLRASTDIKLSGSTLRLSASGTSLNQDTAGFIRGEDAYRDEQLRLSNPNPEAFRDADSQRIQALWSFDDSGIELRPYVRRSDMQFLQHFLPGQPLEENGHVSAGLIANRSIERLPAVWTFGVDIEWSDSFLRQTQAGPTPGSAFLRETRPQGKHYDYDVVALSAAPWMHVEVRVHGALTIDAGLRAESVRYDYRSNILDGNTRDDGIPCGFGGCLYSRPADRKDTFRNLAPKFGANWRIDSNSSLFARIARGFRAPQMTELYRLQSGQSIANLSSERIDSIELGWRRLTDRVGVEVAAYWMAKRGGVLRDTDGFNVSTGRSRHQGLEVSAHWQIVRKLRARINGSIARHVYDFDLVAARGETFVSGNDVDTAPRWLGSAELSYEPTDAWAFKLQWISQGRYYLDAENSFTYPGHDLVNLRGRVNLNHNFTVTARLNNVLNSNYADRADFAFGNYRYIPGRGRELFLELRYEQ